MSAKKNSKAALRLFAPSPMWRRSGPAAGSAGLPILKILTSNQAHMEDTMKFRPLHDRVVVKRIDAEEKTAGGIIIPDTAKEKPSQGQIVSVGPGGRDEAGKLIPIDVK